MVKLEKINYKELNARAQETYNYQRLGAKLVEYGFATNWPSVDFESADFVAVHFNGIDILKVQLKARITIDRKYIGKDIWIAFPAGNNFYLLPHDELVKIVGENSNWLDTPSWINNNAYSAAKPSKALKGALSNFLIKQNQ